MTTPTGSPPQTRLATIESYGGHPQKRDYQAQGVVNPLTDLSAAAFLRLTADVAACARVAPFCVMTVKCNDTSPAAPTVLRCQQMGAVALGGYAGGSPPNIDLPTLARTGNGAFTVTWPETTSDDYEVEADTNLVHVQASVQGSSDYVVEAEFTDERTLTIAVFESSGGPAISDATVTIEVG